METCPKVSIVIVNLNGKHHLDECFSSISKLAYPKEQIEVVLVDNGSNDGSVEYIKDKFPWVKLLCNDRNEGFAKPSNDGARAATGEYVAFLNNDMRVDKDWLKELINSLKNANAQCAGSVIQNWNGKLLDFGGGGINFQGFGYQDDFKSPMSRMNKILTEDKDILFACGGSMIVKRDMFLFAGGFDEDYFAYYEDVDLGWRLHVLGCRVVLSVKSRVNHKHNSTSKSMTKERIQYLFERNKLYTCYKNYGESNLNAAFLPGLLLDIREGYIGSGIDCYNFDIKNSDAFDDSPVKISTKAAMKFAAMNEFVQNINKFAKKREFIQQNRKATDKEINKVMEKPFMVFPKDSADLLTAEFEVTKAFNIAKTFDTEFKCKVLVITDGEIPQNAENCRPLAIAKTLDEINNFDVTLVAHNTAFSGKESIKTMTYKTDLYDELIQKISEAVVIIICGNVLANLPYLKKIIENKYIVTDFRMNGNENDDERKALNNLIDVTDYFICTDETSKELCIKALEKAKKISPVDKTEGFGIEKVVAAVSAEDSLKSIINFCNDPWHLKPYMTKEEADDADDTEGFYFIGKQESKETENISLEERLSEIEKQQIALEKQIKTVNRKVRESNEMMSDLNLWTELNESRMRKFKSMLSKMPVIKRFFN